MRKIYCFIILVFGYQLVSANDTIIIDSNLTSRFIGKEIDFFEDKQRTLSFDAITKSGKFLPLNKDIANFQVSESFFWLRFTILNTNNTERNLIEVMQPLLLTVDFYYPDSNNVYQVTTGGQQYPFGHRKYQGSAGFVYDLNLKPGETRTYYLKIRGEKQVLVPLQIITEKALDHTIVNRNFWIGCYSGIIIVMVLFNIFIYMSTRDKSYLYYVLHTLFVGLTQATLLGFTFKYFWPNNTWFADYSIFLFTCLVSLAGVQFLIQFMHVKRNAPVFFKMLKGFQIVYVVFLITSAAGYESDTFGAILGFQFLVAIFILVISIFLYKKGFAEAKYYLIGWSSLLLGIMVYVFKDVGILPYNNFTAYSLLFGSSAQVTLLSFALADKINIYKKDKEKSQEEALQALLENERIIREQNVMLENKVTERTQELRVVNSDLSKVLQDLKDAEGHLVESEKMAALGQLTAGIAHEINNPINFVTSNVVPLKRDVDVLLDIMNNIEEIGLSEVPKAEKLKQMDECKEEYDFDYLKTEINHLINGISEGANRTASIVKGLRIFSRVDEDDLKLADINEGLDSTIVLVNNLLSNKITLKKEYGTLPMIECFPGKLNQVFLNIISNAIHAINKQNGDKPTGILTLKTAANKDHISVHIEDNGTGMDEKTRKKIFEPFFTTKDVGEGTGLGMSIVYNIIKKHNGQIHINSTVGKGTEFIIDLPIIYS